MLMATPCIHIGDGYLDISLHDGTANPSHLMQTLMVFNMDRAILKRKEATLFKCLNMS